MVVARPEGYRCEDIPVEVIERNQRHTFTNLAEARKVFPLLDLHRSSPGFTLACQGRDPVTGALMARFDSWEVDDLLSR